MSSCKRFTLISLVALVFLAMFMLSAQAEGLSLENEALSVTVQPQGLSLTLTDKRSGAVWSHNAQEGLNKNWQTFAGSGVVINASVNDTSVKQFTFANEAVLSRSGDAILAELDFEDAGITLMVKFTLLDDGLRVQVPFDSIAETKDSHRLHNLTLFPFLGASFAQQEGFILVPDGSGAIIDLSVPTKARQPYKQAVYGEDAGFQGILAQSNLRGLRQPMQALVPAYGMNLGGQGLLHHITGGAEHASIQAYAAGITTNYNWASAVFTYRDFYNVYSSSIPDLARTVRLNQERPNAFDAQLDIYPLSSDQAAYDGMARKLRGILQQSGELQRGHSQAPALHASVLMADSYKTMLGRTLVTVTNMEQLKGIANGLHDFAGSAILEVDGFAGKGLTLQPPALTRPLANAGEWQALSQSMKDSGSILSFKRDYISVFKGTPGISRRDLSQNIASYFTELRDERNITAADTTAGYWRLLRPEASLRLAQEDLGHLENTGAEGLSLGSLGSLLFSSYGNEPQTRAEAIKVYRELLFSLQARFLSLDRPAAYAWPYADALVNLPLSASGFVIETREVPFLQLVLSESAPLYAPGANFQPNERLYLLKLLSYGMRPSYLLTGDSPSALSRTDSRWLFTSEWDVWKEHIKSHMDYLRPAFDVLHGASLDGHRMLAPGVFESSFSNGVRLVVNMAGIDYVADGLLVPAMDYELMREEGL